MQKYKMQNTLKLSENMVTFRKGYWKNYWR